MRSPASKSQWRARTTHSLAAIALVLFLSAPTHAQEVALTGIWESESYYGPALRGVLTVESGAEWRATIMSAETRFKPSGDSVRFAFQGGLGEFRGTLNKERTAIRGFWIQETSVTLGYRMSTPLTLRLASPNIFHGDVVPLDDRYSLYINFWRSPSSGFVATIRNPDQNDRFHLFVFSVIPQKDSVIFRARPDTTQPERRFAAAYDSARGELRIDWLPANRSVIFRKRPEAEPVAIYPRTPRGLPYTYRKPEQTTDGWTTSRASVVGFDEKQLAGLVQRIADTLPTFSRFPAIHSILIARNGKLVLEEYFGGHDRERTHDVRSIGKSFTNVMLGALIQEGKKVGPETKLVDLTKSLQPFANPDPRKNDITLGHVMTHSTGLDCDDNEDTPGNEGAQWTQTQQPDFWKFLLDLRITHNPGEYWAYCSSGMNLMGAALTAVSGQSVYALFDRTVARPLQFERYYWNLTPTGEGYLGGGAFMRPRDLLKIGQTYLNGGLWNGKRIVPASWVATSTETKISWEARGENVSAGSDGYAWHLNTLKSGDRTYKQYEANGNGGQLLMMIPELDLVVVFTAGNYGNGGVWRHYRDNFLVNVIIPAIRAESSRN